MASVARTQSRSAARSRRIAPAVLAAALLLPLTACGGSASAGDSKSVTVTVGYQSKTINTVTAGTLLRSHGYFESALKAQGARDGITYKVEWQDYDTGAPITAADGRREDRHRLHGRLPAAHQRLPGQAAERARHRMVSVTGYNPRGALNTVVVAAGFAGCSRCPTCAGQEGVDQRRLGRPRHARPRPGAGRHRPGQGRRASSTSSRRSALRRWSPGSVDALSQFVAWPGLLAFQGKAKAAVRRRRARPAHLPRRHRARRLRRPASGRWSTPSCRPSSRPPTISTPTRSTAAENRRRGHRPARRRSSTSTTARAASPPSTPPSSRRWSPHSRRTCRYLSRSAKLARAGRRRLRRRQLPREGVRRPDTPRPPSRQPGRTGPVRKPATGSGSKLATADAPSPSPTRPACCGTSPRTARRRSGPRTSPTPTTGTRWFADRSVWVQDGADLQPVRHRGRRRALRPPPTPGARSSSYAGTRGAAGAQPTIEPARLRRRSAAVYAAGAAASLLAALGIWQLLTSQRRRPVAAVRPAPDRHRGRPRVRAPRRHRRSTGRTSRTA